MAILPLSLMTSTLEIREILLAGSSATLSIAATLRPDMQRLSHETGRVCDSRRTMVHWYLVRTNCRWNGTVIQDDRVMLSG